MFERKKMVAGACGLLLVGAVAAPMSAASFSRSAAAPDASGGQQPFGGCGTTVLTHSVSQAVTSLNSVSCNAGGLHTNNSYFRSFDLAALGHAGFTVCAVEIGVETAVGAGGTQPITINLFENAAVDFPTSTGVAIGSSSTTVADQSLALANFAVAGTAAANTELVVEIFTPNGQVAGNSFFIGSNAGGQSDVSYIQAADCGVVAPTPTGSIGFPNMHIVMNVYGTPGGGEPTPSVLEIPTIGTVGALALVALLALAAALTLRRRRAA